MVCLDCQGKTWGEILDERGISRIEEMAKIYGVEPTVRGMAQMLDKVLGFDLEAQMDELEWDAQ